MGALLHENELRQKQSQSWQVINDVYRNFKQSNRVIVKLMRKQNRISYKTKNAKQMIKQLMQPFEKAGKYSCMSQIPSNFKMYFLKDFEMIWNANSEQFYELLLINCNVNLKQANKKNLQRYFYDVAIHHLESSIPDTFFDTFFSEEINIKIINTSIAIDQHAFSNGKQLNEQNETEQKKVHIQTEQKGVEIETHREELRLQSQIKEKLLDVLNKTNNLPQEEIKIRKEEYFSTLRALSCSLLLPETAFVDRLSQITSIEVMDLIRYYEQLSNTLRQVFYSNNLISCPLKHFVLSLEERVIRKKIKQSTPLLDQLSTTSEQTHGTRKAQQTYTNVLLQQVKYFLDAYTEFVWKYLQIHQMSQSRFGRIVNPQILFGIIFKSVWGFVDWILQLGYQYEQSKLEDYYQTQSIKNQSNLSEQLVSYFLSLIQNLRNQNHPQQYLKKIVLFYRQVSKKCQNADELLLVYEEIVGRAIMGQGSKMLYLFRMKNVIEKLLKIDESSLSGGEISYSWATWCILIELLRQRIVARYGNDQSSQESKRSDSKLTENSLLVRPILAETSDLFLQIK